MERFRQSKDMLEDCAKQAKALQDALSDKFKLLDSLSLNNPKLSKIIASAKEAMQKGDFSGAKTYVDKIYELLK